MPSNTSKSKMAHDPYLAFRFREFRLYTISNFLLTAANQMVSTTIGWELYGKTGRALDLGLAGFFTVLPFLLLGLLGGNVADRFDRRKVTIISTLVYTLGLAGLALSSVFKDRLEHFNLFVFGFLFLMGSCNAFYVPAKQALFRQLVPRGALPNAVTWGSSAFQTAAVTGPAFCGFLLARLPYFTIYTATIFFELNFILILSLLRLKPTADKKAPISLRSLAEGGRFVWNTKPILATLTMDLFAVLLGGCTALLPIFTKDILHAGPETLGWLRATPAIGALFMALLVARAPLKNPGVTLLWSVGGFGAATVFFGLSTNVWLSMAMMFLIGALDEVSVIIRGTLVQVLTPDRLLGRVQSVNYLFINSSNELGAFESGVAAAILGAVPAVVLGGVGAIGIVLGVNWIWPQVAKLGPLHKMRNGLT